MLTDFELDEARRRAFRSAEDARDEGMMAHAQVLALLYVGDCIRYSAEMALFIAEHRQPSVGP